MSAKKFARYSNLWPVVYRKVRPLFFLFSGRSIDFPAYGKQHTQVENQNRKKRIKKAS